MHTIKAIIVDDEPDARESLQREITKSCPELEIIAEAGNAFQAMEEIEKHRPDMVFLDVEMPGKSGLEMARDLKEKKIKTKLVFVTAFDQYSIEAIRYAAFDYLLKPVDMDELKRTVERFITESQEDELEQKINRLTTWLSPDRLQFNTKDGYIFVRPADIVFCQAEGKMTQLTLSNGRKELVTGKKDKVLSLLPPELFVRINRTVCINRNYLVKVDSKTNRVLLDNMLVEYEFKASPRKIKNLI
jgi:two-component system LytT family response regulator